MEVSNIYPCALGIQRAHCVHVFARMTKYEHTNHSEGPVHAYIFNIIYVIYNIVCVKQLQK